MDWPTVSQVIWGVVSLPLWVVAGWFFHLALGGVWGWYTTPQGDNQLLAGASAFLVIAFVAAYTAARTMGLS